MKFLIFNGLLLLTICSVAQNSFHNGYVITENDEVIYGQIEVQTQKKSYLSCRFKNPKGEITDFKNLD